MSKHRTFKCPELTRGETVCPFGCTWDHPICHMYKQKRCYWQQSTYCCKGWHRDQKDAKYYKKGDSARSSRLHEETQTSEPEESGNDPYEARRKKRRCDRNGSEEADFQIALAKLKVDADMLDIATLEHAYRRRMSVVSSTAPLTEVQDRLDDLTQAFRLVETHLDP